MKYRARPVEIEAFRIGYESLPDWFMDKVSCNDIILLEASLSDAPYPVYARIKTLEGTMTASTGDYVVRGTKGEIYPVKPDIFEHKYEVVDD